jgi:hypothetical protein
MCIEHDGRPGRDWSTPRSGHRRLRGCAEQAMPTLPACQVHGHLVRSDAFDGKGHAILTGTPLVVEPANKATRSFPSRPLTRRKGTKDVNPGAGRLPPWGTRLRLPG